MDAINLKKEKNIIFPVDAGITIAKLLEKYGLKEKQEEAVKKLIQAKNFKERAELAEESPGRKIAKLMRDAAENKMSFSDLALALQNLLALSEEKAKQLARDLEKEVLAFAQEVFIDKEEALSDEPQTELQPAALSQEATDASIHLPKTTLTKEKLLPKRQNKKADTYRETVD
ncbi:MAG: hypothetical protein Q7S82_00515 [bacterium]|nr:hypothetical protein [bacterium]